MATTAQTLFTTSTAPTVAEVEKIAAIADPVLRNLLITQCYCEQSTAFAKRTGFTANWCTFATWASKQAGQTIRAEDLQRTLKAILKNEPGTEEALSLLTMFANRLGASETIAQIRQSTLGTLLAKAANKAAGAVGRGNKKVFEEIAYQFARFHQLCFHDQVYTKEHLDEFNKGLKRGLPPDGQDCLQKAFSRYYQAFFETDEKKKAEMFFSANLEIGLHEQTRLQPEIADALNAGAVSADEVKAIVVDRLLANAGFFLKLRFFFQKLFGQTGILDRAVEMLTQSLQLHLRRILTNHLMTLSLPPDNRLHLGKDLTAVYPSALKTLTNADLLSFLHEIDPVPDSLLQSGATDWANFQERMHFIAELFRCYHEEKSLFTAAFSVAQTGELKEGKLPAGQL